MKRRPVSASIAFTLLLALILPWLLSVATCVQPGPATTNPLGSTSSAPLPGKPDAPASQTTQPQPPPVPAEYQAIYGELMRKLDSFDSMISAKKASNGKKVVLAAELLTANSDIGEGLFTEVNFQANRVYLDALQAINVTGVQVSIMYPMLTTGFPNSDKYLAFYKKIVQEVRSRKMALLVKVGNPFANSVYSDLTISFAGLTLEKYRAEKKAMVHLVARELKPDYLTICNEPNTEKMTIGILQSPSQYAGTVKFILEGMDRNGILVGGGAGTWDDLSYMTALADTDLDFLDAHVYPLDFLNRFIDIADIATAKNKRMVIGEAWAYKLSGSELGGLGDIAATAKIYGRDVFSFWEPVDSRFLSSLVNMARLYGYEFIAPFWSTYLYGYVDYNNATRGL